MSHRVQPGQRNPLTRATVINDVLDATDWFRQQQRLGAPTQTTSTATIANRVDVKNLTGSTLPRGSAVQLGSYLLTAGLDSCRPWFQGNSVSSLSGNLAILTQPLVANQIGEAAVAGICTALVNFGSTTDKYASFATSSSQLTSGASGPIKILQTPSATGAQEVWVQFAPPPTAITLAKLTSSSSPITPGNSGTFEIYTGTPGSEVDAGYSVSGYVRFEPVDKAGFAILENAGYGWYCVSSDHLALQISGTLSGSLSAGGSVSCSVTSYRNGISPGGTVTVYSAENFFTGSSGAIFKAEYDRWAAKYYFTGVACGS